MSRRLGTDAFVREIQAMAAALSPGERRLVALAGPPGSGKSYVAERLLERGSVEPGAHTRVAAPLQRRRRLAGGQV